MEYKRITVSVVLVFAVMVLALPVFAEEDGVNTGRRASTTEQRIERREDLREKREDRRTEIEERRASTTERRLEIKEKNEERRASTTERINDRREAREERIEERKASSTERRVEMQRGLAKRKADYTARVLTATVERLGKITTRIESRITKIETDGGTTTEAKIFVAEARMHLSLATSSIATFTSIDLSSDKAQENFERVRALATEIKNHIKDAHQSLKNAVRAIKRSRSDSDE